jgi:hypothetical protein
MFLLNQQYNEKQKQFLHRKSRTLGCMERIISPWYLWRVVRNWQGIFDGCKTLVLMKDYTTYDIAIMTLEKIGILQEKVKRIDSLFYAAKYIDYNRVYLLREHQFRGKVKPIEQVLVDRFDVSLEDAKILLSQRVEGINENDFK